MNEVNGVLSTNMKRVTAQSSDQAEYGKISFESSAFTLERSLCFRIKRTLDGRWDRERFWRKIAPLPQRRRHIKDKSWFLQD
ncbi:hypothetical protein [Nitrosomonas ureae]|uniref:hypothetical protein n=1 Tax=Nitrosomonas ureae TaxID=44577 RepID=UPI001160C153|nr:hypothetical protein [Nitrosomonas ureae]